MTIQDYDYTHSEKEFDEMRELLVHSYSVSRKPRNWRLALLENWNYASRYLEPLEYFTSRVRLWRNADGDVVGFLIRYYDKTYAQIHPEYPFLEDRMLDWAERNWAGDTERIATIAFEYDVARKSLLETRGYEDQGAIESVRIYALSRAYPDAPLPCGFRIAALGEVGDCAGRVALENSIWNATLDEAWFKGKASAPHYSLDWDLVVLSPDNQQVAACLVWIDSRNRAAEIDPLGTHPDYRRRGLARALVTESFRRMREAGVRYAYIASESDPNNVVNRLYGSLQPIETYRGHLWTKQVV